MRGWRPVSSAPGKTAITAAGLLNDRVIPFFAGHGISLLRILTGRGTEYCGKAGSHAYQLYLAAGDLDHTRAKANSPQSETVRQSIQLIDCRANGICERFHRTIKDEFCDIAFRKKLYRPVEELQVDLDAWLARYNEQRPQFGKIPLWQDAYADLPRNAAYCQGQDDHGFRSIGQSATHSQHRELRCLSDQV